MARQSRSDNRDLEALMGDVAEYGVRSADDLARRERMADENRRRGGRLSAFGAGVATLVSVFALVFSGFSFYETVLKSAELRFYQPPLIYMYRQSFRDVFAIPVTISNDGAQRGTVMSFDLTIVNLKTNESKTFQNLHFGSSPKGALRLFTPITVSGRSSFSDVVLFHALKTGSFVETTGGVALPLRLTLKMNIDTSGDWFAPRQPEPISFDMTASFIAGMRAMEGGQPTQLHDARWANERKRTQQ
ncbi:MAG: hypothetical protein AAF732_06360 [Pseudomonadota bacterium]